MVGTNHSSSELVIWGICWYRIYHSTSSHCDNLKSLNGDRCSAYTLLYRQNTHNGLVWCLWLHITNWQKVTYFWTPAEDKFHYLRSPCFFYTSLYGSNFWVPRNPILMTSEESVKVDKMDKFMDSMHIDKHTFWVNTSFVGHRIKIRSVHVLL